LWCGITIDYGSEKIEFKTGKGERVADLILDKLKEAIQAEKPQIDRKDIDLT